MSPGLKFKNPMSADDPGPTTADSITLAGVMGAPQKLTKNRHCAEAFDRWGAR